MGGGGGSKGSGRFPTRKAVSQIGPLVKQATSRILANFRKFRQWKLTPLIQQKIKTTAENGLNTATVIKEQTNRQLRKKSLRIRKTFKPA